MTHEQAVAFFAELFGGEHHIPGEVKPHGQGWRTWAWGGIATYDMDRLTRLVLLAHDCCVRVELIQSGRARIGIAIWQRHTRDGSSMNRHPTMEQALAAWRERNPVADRLTGRDEGTLEREDV